MPITPKKKVTPKKVIQPTTKIVKSIEAVDEAAPKPGYKPNVDLVIANLLQQGMSMQDALKKVK